MPNPLLPTCRLRRRSSQSTTVLTGSLLPTNRKFLPSCSKRSCLLRSISISDDGLILISFRCPILTRLKLCGCREVTDVGMALMAKNCKGLKKFSDGSCMFGAKGMNALLDNCSSLEELSVKRLRGINDGGSTEAIGPGAAASSLKTICLKVLYNEQVFAPLISGSKRLKTLKLLRCLGDRDRSLEMIAVPDNYLVEVHLERLHVSDIGLIAVAEHCKYLRKLHIDGWRTNRIGNEGLIAIAKQRIEAFAWGCPNLVKIKVKKCRNMTFELGDWLRAKRGSLVVNLDACAVEPEVEVVASASDNGKQEDVVEFPASHMVVT
ncbi:hypothetical protein Ccrd_024805 [Cynara cardunculus var. scolymus]|uniref:Leucine-rich repeat, cysteine-containing subtype n=1 Tax=Cynara cardunculus var. scolymus TaxID=59895 RepID=A0A103XBX1_CYNCS|nr:hypothetical protein Ccrd_024805 [Cynara cardunculus var. scolymus]